MRDTRDAQRGQMVTKTPMCCQRAADTGDRIIQVIHVLSHGKAPFSTMQLAEITQCDYETAQRYLDSDEAITRIGPASPPSRGFLYFSRSKERNKK